MRIAHDIRVALFYLPRWSVGDAQRFLPRCFEWLHSNLNEGLHFHPVTGTVDADGFLPHFGKEKRVVTRAFWTFRATPCGREHGFVLRVERRVGQIEQDFLLDPRAELTDGDSFRFSILENRGCCFVTRKALLQGAALVVRLEPRNFKRMRDREPANVERLLRFLNQVYQTQSRIYVFLGTSDFLGKGFDGVGLVGRSRTRF